MNKVLEEVAMILSLCSEGLGTPGVVQVKHPHMRLEHNPRQSVAGPVFERQLLPVGLGYIDYRPGVGLGHVLRLQPDL